MAKSADAFRTISEVADELEIPKHVLRFWENRFPQIKPMKRGGGRRYYRPADLDLLRGIRHLLHNEGFTIKGVQKILREKGVEAVKLAWQRGQTTAGPAVAAAPGAATGAGSRGDARDKRRGKATKPGSQADVKATISKIVAELTACRNLLLGKDAPAEAAASAKARARARR